MKFRPCIDIHAGVVKQIVGSTLTENDNDKPAENFVSSMSAADYALMYQRDKLTGGHVIMLGKNCEVAATAALHAYKGGLQIGGGINLENAVHYLDTGASHVIVTSYVFNDGKIDFDRLKSLSQLVTPQRLVIDLSCRKKLAETQESQSDDQFYVVTNKWTKYTDFVVNKANLVILAQYCDEFLVHGVDVEGKRAGIEIELVRLLGEFVHEYEQETGKTIPITYAGGVRSIEDLELVRLHGQDKVDCTVGSALDCFGGDLPYDDVLSWHRQMNPIL